MRSPSCLGALLCLVALARAFFAEVEPRQHGVSRSDFTAPILSRTRRDSSDSDMVPTASSKSPKHPLTEAIVLNAVASNRSVTVRFAGQKQGLQLAYGEFKRVFVRFELDSTFRIEIGQVIYTRKINEYFRTLPNASDSIFLVITRSSSGGIDETFVRTPKVTQAGHFHLYTFNAYGSLERDVIAFDHERFSRGDASLHLVADGVKVGRARYAILWSADYEIKVVGHKSVFDIHDFKNVDAFLSPFYGYFEASQIYISVLFGDSNHPDKYPPQYKIFPPPQKAKTPLPRPVTDVYVLNAYPDVGEISISFDTYDFQPVSYGFATKGRLYLRRGDGFDIMIDDDTANDAVVNVDVPYVDGMCVIVPDSGNSGSLEVLVSCWDLDRIRWNSSDQAWIFTYNTVKNCDEELDFLFLGAKSPQLCDKDCLRFYATAYELSTGRGMFGVIDAGTYKLKVVSAGLVNDSAAFRRIRPIVDERTVVAAPGVFYFSVLSGECKNDDFPALYFSFPPFGKVPQEENENKNDEDPEREDVSPEILAESEDFLTENPENIVDLADKRVGPTSNSRSLSLSTFWIFVLCGILAIFQWMT